MKLAKPTTGNKLKYVFKLKSVKLEIPISERQNKMAALELENSKVGIPISVQRNKMAATRVRAEKVFQWSAYVDHPRINRRSTEMSETTEIRGSAEN